MVPTLAIFCARSASGKRKNDKDDDNYGTEGMCLGMCPGTGIETALDNNTGIGISLGMLIGLAIGTGMKNENGEKGFLYMEIKAPDGTAIYRGDGKETTDFTVNITESGVYTIVVCARHAKGGTIRVVVFS